ncbi:hypothetical protein Droror1_Dr00016798 [Drosera rotundifolia]
MRMSTLMYSHFCNDKRSILARGNVIANVDGRLRSFVSQPKQYALRVSPLPVAFVSAHPSPLAPLSSRLHRRRRAALPSPSRLAAQPSSPSATPSPASNTTAQSIITSAEFITTASKT